MPERHVKFVFREFPSSIGEEQVEAAVRAAGLTALYSRFDHLLRVFFLAFPMPLDAAIGSAQKLGAELGADVEVALLQKLHRPRSSRRDQRQGTIEDSAHYREFVQRCEHIDEAGSAATPQSPAAVAAAAAAAGGAGAGDADVRGVAPIISFLSSRKFSSAKKALGSSAKVQVKRAKALAKRQKKEMAKAARKASHKGAASAPQHSAAQSSPSADAADASVPVAAGKTPFKIMQRTTNASSSGNSSKAQDAATAGGGKRSGRSKKPGRKNASRAANRGADASGAKPSVQKEAWTR